MSKRILGLDIRSDSVTATLVTASLKTHEVEAFEHVKISKNVSIFAVICENLFIFVLFCE